MLIIELNEFDPVFLKEKAKELHLKNILYFLNLKHSKTYTLDKKEHHGLDPWVQWVSIHTGKPFKEHKVSRLGQTSSQKEEQIWNRISNLNSKRWGVWGVMNAPCGSQKGRDFFIPDPWSFEEVAYPAVLNDFLSLPRYVAKSYLDPQKTEILKNGLRTLSFIFRKFGKGIKRKIVWNAFKAFIITGINIHSFTTLLDYMSCIYFLEYKKQYKSDFSLIFLNHIAHLQHQFWNIDSKISSQMKFGLIICDEILGELKREVFPSEALILINGFKQKNVANKGYFVYRQINPDKFIKIICPIKCKVRQNMTNDGSLIFNHSSDADKAEKLLKNIKLKYKNSNLFFIERLNKNRIFYQIEISKKVRKDEKIILKNKEIRFFDHIELITERTGAHIPQGDIFYRNINFPNELNNHEVFHYIEEYFKKNI